MDLAEAAPSLGEVAAFKNPSWIAKKQQERSKKGNRKAFSSVKQMLSLENYHLLAENAPSYTGIESPPSLVVPQRYSDVSLLRARYYDKRTMTRYSSSEEYELIQSLPSNALREMLAVRNAAPII